MSIQGLVSQAEFSRLRDVSRAMVTKWKAAGLLVLIDGLVDVAASEALLATRPATYRGGSVSGVNRPRTDVNPVNTEQGDELTAPANDGDMSAGGISPGLLDATPEEIAAATSWTLAEATRQKEIYLALLRKLEFDRESQKVVEIDDVVKIVVGEYAIIRNRILSMGAKLAPRLAVLRDAVQVKAIIDAEAAEALTELSDEAAAGIVSSLGSAG